MPRCTPSAAVRWRRPRDSPPPTDSLPRLRFTAATRRCWMTPTLTPCTCRCRRACTWSGQCWRRRRRSMCFWRSLRLWMWRSWIRFWRRANPMECSLWTAQCGYTTLGRLRWRSSFPIRSVLDNSNRYVLCVNI